MPRRGIYTNDHWLEPMPITAEGLLPRLRATACTHLEYGCVLKVTSMRFEDFVIRWV